jgi:Glycoside hydrolase family 44
MINTYKTASNARTLLTIPIIPYVNKSAAWNCSFPVSVYGAQQSTNPYVHPNGDNCGNSIASNGTQLLDNNIFANHIDNTVALQQAPAMAHSPSSPSTRPPPRFRPACRWQISIPPRVRWSTPIATRILRKSSPALQSR